MSLSKNILFTDETHPYLPEALKNMGFQCHFHFETDREMLKILLPGFGGIVCKSRLKLDSDFLQQATYLKFIARAGVGLEHIDLDFAEAKGVRVFASPEGSRDTVAEHTVGLLLGLMNNLHRADRQIRAGQWIRKANTGTELGGKTVGILGYGNMGQAFARRLSGFNVRVLAYDKYKTGYGDAFAEAADLQDIFARADILSIHIPYSPDNHHFVNDDFLNRFEKPIWLVNTARGTVLSTVDLIKHLHAGKVRGAALDVIEYEEMSFNSLNLQNLPEPFHLLLQMDNVILSPHIAGWSIESHLGHAKVLANKIREWLGEDD